MSFAILNANARQIPLKANSIQCVVTSPPYWGLRDYGTATWVGGDEGCDHKAPSRFDYKLNPGLGPTGVQTQSSNLGSGQSAYRNNCPKCSATRIDSQIGLEKTPEEYVAKIVAVFEEVKRVLRDDGTCWVNLGDSYASQGGPQVDQTKDHKGSGYHGNNRNNGNLKPKDLVGVPWRVAFALQAAGWYLRSDIIWSKSNPMPESVTDRPTKAHEYIFLLTKRERYFFDADAVREPALQPLGIAQLTGQHKADAGGFTTNVHGNSTLGTNQGNAGRNIRTVWEIATQPLNSAVSYDKYRIVSLDCLVHGCRACREHAQLCGGRLASFCLVHNLRSDTSLARVLKACARAKGEYPFLVREDFSSATFRNNEIHRKVNESELNEIFSYKHLSHTECIGPCYHWCAKCDHKHVSNISVDAEACATGPNLLEQTMCDSVGTQASWPPERNCSCYYGGKIEKRQDHFASFPEEIAIRCIKAGTSEKGACAECGAPWERVTERIEEKLYAYKQIGIPGESDQRGRRTESMGLSQYKPIGWQPTCKHDAPSVPCLVLDPFSGAGTVPLVADKLNRKGIGLDLKFDYCRMARNRCYDDAPLLAER